MKIETHEDIRYAFASLISSLHTASNHLNLNHPVPAAHKVQQALEWAVQLRDLLQPQKTGQ